jgi:outer membrane lipase/esterase
VAFQSSGLNAAFRRNTCVEFWHWGLLFLSALELASCGGHGSDGNQAPKVKFSSMVGFGESLSDAGADKVGLIAGLGGGMYIVNSDSSKNWITLMSA